MNSPVDYAKIGREALELKVLARLIDRDTERGNYFPELTLFLLWMKYFLTPGSQAVILPLMLRTGSIQSK